MSSTCAVRAQDFNATTTDPNRGHWTVGQLRHVTEALAGTPVAITTDRGTGHTLIGARLVRAYESGEPRILIETTLSTGEKQQTRYRVASLGDTIIPLERTSPTDAKWRALDTYRDEASAAVRWAMANHGEGREGGRWTATPGAAEVFVRWEPTTRHGDTTPYDQRPSRWWGSVPVRDLSMFLRG